jgi:hypothetical protein
MPDSRTRLYANSRADREARGAGTLACSVHTRVNAWFCLPAEPMRSHECERGTQECVRHKLQNFQDQAFQIHRFRYGQENRMVERLGSALQNTQASVCVERSGSHDF